MRFHRYCLRKHSRVCHVIDKVPYQDILSILDSTKFCSSVQNFIDIYFRLSGLPANGQLSDSDCIRVRICEGRFAVLIREVCLISTSMIMFCYSVDLLIMYHGPFFTVSQPIREGNFIIQPKVDFDISVSTVAGLLNLGWARNQISVLYQSITLNSFLLSHSWDDLYMLCFFFFLVSGIKQWRISKPLPLFTKMER